MTKLAKKNYDEIAHAFKHQAHIKQYRYARFGFDKETKHHNDEGRRLYDFFTCLNSLAFTTANNLRENENFDRDVFLKACGMMNHGYGGWSFVPTKEYIDHQNRE